MTEFVQFDDNGDISVVVSIAEEDMSVLYEAPDAIPPIEEEGGDEVIPFEGEATTEPRAKAYVIRVEDNRGVVDDPNAYMVVDGVLVRRPNE